MHLRIFDGISSTGKMIAKVVDYLFNEMFMEGMTTGHMMFPLSKRVQAIKKAGMRIFWELIIIQEILLSSYLTRPFIFTSLYVTRI